MGPIETPRLWLRMPEDADAEPFMAILWDPEVVENKQVTLTEAPGDLGLARRNTAALIDHWKSHGYGLWTVVEKSTRQVVGCVGLQNWEGWPGVELAWAIHRARWNLGFATESAIAALEWAWSTTNIDHIISLINADDTRSKRVAVKVGEHFERADVDPINQESIHVYGIYRPTSEEQVTGRENPGRDRHVTQPADPPHTTDPRSRQALRPAPGQPQS
jgi:RimJ/RimL family protein N-acetyltransferase